MDNNTYTIYERDIGRLLSFSADDSGDATDEGIEAIGLTPLMGDPVISRGLLVTYVRFVKGADRRDFQIVRGYAESPWPTGPWFVIWDCDESGDEVYWTGADGSLSQGFTPVPDEAAVFATRELALEGLSIARMVRPFAEIGEVDA